MAEDHESIRIKLEGAREGNRDAQDDLFVEVQPLMFKLANSQLDKGLRRQINPSDIVQMTMARATAAFDRFRGNSAGEFYRWLEQILKNEIHVTRRNLHRQKRDIRNEVELSSPSGNLRVADGVDRNPTPSSEAIGEEQAAMLEKTIESLPPDYAKVLRLRSLEELPFADIAKQMGRSYDSVTKLWNRAVIRLQAELKSKSEIE